MTQFVALETSRYNSLWWWWLCLLSLRLI